MYAQGFNVAQVNQALSDSSLPLIVESSSLSPVSASEALTELSSAVRDLETRQAQELAMLANEMHLLRSVIEAQSKQLEELRGAMRIRSIDGQDVDLVENARSERMRVAAEWQLRQYQTALSEQAESLVEERAHRMALEAQKKASAASAATKSELSSPPLSSLKTDSKSAPTTWWKRWLGLGKEQTG